MNEYEIPQECSASMEPGETLEENGLKLNKTLGSINPGVIAYGINRVLEIPEVKERINETKESISEAINDVTADFSEKIKNGITEFCRGAYENVKDFFTDLKYVENKEYASLSKEFIDAREFGIHECSDAAIRLFTPQIINSWGVMSTADRVEIAKAYADEVAKAFDLANYKGVLIEQMDRETKGFNNGDGYIHISDTLIDSMKTPFEIMNTVTHELRHQYQVECINGYHDVPKEVRQEWSAAHAIYNYNTPSCYDPWGYTYNPLELDSRHAGETVVRNVSGQFINNLIA